MLLALFLLFALSDVVTTYIGLHRGLREGHPLLRYIDKKFIPVAQIALYTPVAIVFGHMPLVAQIIAIALPAFAVINNVVRLRK